MNRLSLLALSSLFFCVVQFSPAEEKLQVDVAPEVVGEWSGEWGPFNPAEGSEVDPEKCKVLDCQVIRTDTGWEATFQGECGRPYKYTITMDGRQSGASVLFRGTTDLGEKDGGIHDWVGRATVNEFIGFYTSAHHTGVFSLKRTE